MQTHAEAIGPMVAALAAALADESAVTNLLAAGANGIFEGEAPVTTAAAGPAPSYLVISMPAGQDDSLFMKVGAGVRCSIDLWCDEQVKVIALYTQVAKVLDRQSLTVEDGSVSPPAPLSHLSGLTRLLATPRDPGRRRLYHGVVQYEALVR